MWTIVSVVGGLALLAGCGCSQPNRTAGGAGGGAGRHCQTNRRLWASVDLKRSLRFARILRSGAAPICARPAEKAAVGVSALVSQLQLITMTCGTRDKYNALIRHLRPALVTKEKNLRAFFARAYGKRGQTEHDKYITELANLQSALALKSGDRFCSVSSGMFDQVMQLSTMEELATYTQSKFIQQALAVDECPAAARPKMTPRGKGQQREAATPMPARRGRPTPRFDRVLCTHRVMLGRRKRDTVLLTVRLTVAALYVRYLRPLPGHSAGGSDRRQIRYRRGRHTVQSIQWTGGSADYGILRWLSNSRLRALARRSDALTVRSCMSSVSRGEA